MGAIFFCLLTRSVSALTKWEYKDWQTAGGYGKKDNITSNITNLKGEATEKGGMKYGPFNKSSTAKLSDGITEEVYVGLEKENYNNSDLFELSIAINNKSNEYLTEAVVMTQKSGDSFILTATWAKNFKAIIKEDGVYTYRWEFKSSAEGKIQVKFTVLNYEEEIQTTGFIDLDKEAKNASNVRYLWACNIKAAYGVDIYTQLPIRDNQEIENPDTSDNLLSYILIPLLVLLGSMFLIKKIKSI